MVLGQLKKNIAFWRSINAFQIIKVLEHCYCLPFIQDPIPAFTANYTSAEFHHRFVESAVLEFLKAVSVSLWEGS